MIRSVLAVAAASLLMAGCATSGRVAAEPTVRTVRVEVPVVQPCPALERLGPRPNYPDTNSAITAAVGLADKIRLLLAGRVLRIAREDAAEEAMRACATPEAPPG